MRINETDGVSASSKHLVFAYYVTGHGFGHATRVVEVSFSPYYIFVFQFQSHFISFVLDN